MIIVNPNISDSEDEKDFHDSSTQTISQQTTTSMKSDNKNTTMEKDISKIDNHEELLYRPRFYMPVPIEQLSSDKPDTPVDDMERNKRFPEIRRECLSMYSRILHIRNLPQTVQDKELFLIFREHGIITKISIHYSKKFAFITMQWPGDAHKAINELNGRVLDGQKMYVSWWPGSGLKKLLLDRFFDKQTGATPWNRLNRTADFKQMEDCLIDEESRPQKKKERNWFGTLYNRKLTIIMIIIIM